MNLKIVELKVYNGFSNFKKDFIMVLSIGSNLYNNVCNDFSFSIMNNDKFVPKATSYNNYNKVGNNTNQSLSKVQNYATEDELIYEKKMDLDEDGTITFDEVKEYCEKNKVNLNEVLNKWQNYRMLQNEEEVTKEVMKSLDNVEEKPEEDNQIYAKKGDDNYETEMDLNDDDVVTYKEYYEYCSKNNIENKSKNNIKDIIEEYGLSEDDTGDTLKTEGNIETVA